MAKVVTIFDSYATLATAFSDAGYEVQAVILSNDDERLMLVSQKMSLIKIRQQLGLALNRVIS